MLVLFAFSRFQEEDKHKAPTYAIHHPLSLRKLPFIRIKNRDICFLFGPDEGVSYHYEVGDAGPYFFQAQCGEHGTQGVGDEAD